MTLSRTRLNLKAYAIQACHAGGIDATAVARVERAIENGLDMLLMERCWAFMQDTYDIVCKKPWTGGATTGTAAIAVGATTLTVSSADALPADIVGQYIQVNAESHWYEIVTRTSDTVLEVRHAYSNESETDLTASAFSIMYPLYDLPTNFFRIRPEGGGLIDTNSGGGELAYSNFGVTHYLHAERVGSGEPEAFGLQAKRHDANQWQLFMYPAPSRAKRYQLVYFRKPGWYDTNVPATSEWKPQATADTNYVDWPDKLSFVLEAAVAAAVAKEIKPDLYPKLQSDFMYQASVAASMDRVSAKPALLSRGSRAMGGTYYRFGS